MILSLFIGFLYLAVIRTDIITTYAGSTTTSGYAGDTAAASSVTPGYPWTIDSAVVTAPSAAPTLLPVVSSPPTFFPSLGPSTTFIISTIAGTGSTSYSGDGGAAISATLYVPYGAALDSSGTIHISYFYSFFLHFNCCFLFLQATCTSPIVTITASAR